jgi:Flp pilus assembly protein TadD
MSSVQTTGGPMPAALAPGFGSPTLEAGAALQDAEKLRRAGDFKRAIAVCERLLGAFPDYYGALQVLALVLSEAGKHQAALLPAIRAAMVNPRDSYAAWFLSTLYSELGAEEMALRSVRQALELKPEEPGALTTLGTIYKDAREYELAAAAYKSALHIDPAIVEAWLGLASSLEHIGDLSGAVAALEEVIAGDISAPIGALAALSQLPSSLHKVDILALLEKHQRPDFKSEERASIVPFVRGAVLDRAGRHAEAWKEFVTANSMVYPTHREEARKRARSQRDFLSMQARDPALDESAISDETPMPLFILGPSRSGKSTLEQLAAQLDGVRRGFETTFVRSATKRTFHSGGLPPSGHPYRLPDWLDERFRESLQQELSQKANGDRIFTSTNPGILQDVYRIASIIPNARFVFVKRDADDVAFRIFAKKYKSGNSYAYHIHTIREFVSWYHRMIDVLLEKLPGRSILVTYEDMVTDPRGALAAAARLCGLPEPNGDLPPIGDDRGCSEPYRKWMEEALRS